MGESWCGAVSSSLEAQHRTRRAPRSHRWADEISGGVGFILPGQGTGRVRAGHCDAAGVSLVDMVRPRLVRVDLADPPVGAVTTRLHGHVSRLPLGLFRARACSLANAQGHARQLGVHELRKYPGIQVPSDESQRAALGLEVLLRHVPALLARILLAQPLDPDEFGGAFRAEVNDPGMLRLHSGQWLATWRRS